MQVKAVTVLVLALAADSVNGSVWRLWRGANAQQTPTVGEAAEPSVEVLAADLTRPTVTDEVTLPELPANVPSPKVSPREPEAEREVPIEEPAAQEEKTELPSAESTPAEQESGSSIFRYLNLLSWFAQNNKANPQTVVVHPEDSTVETTPSEVVGPSGDESLVTEEEVATPSEMAEEAPEVLAKRLEEVSLSDTPADGEESAETSSDEDDENSEDEN